MEVDRGVNCEHFQVSDGELAAETLGVVGKQERGDVADVKMAFDVATWMDCCGAAGGGEGPEGNGELGTLRN